MATITRQRPRRPSHSAQICNSWTACRQPLACALVATINGETNQHERTYAVLITTNLLEQDTDGTRLWSKAADRPKM